MRKRLYLFLAIGIAIGFALVQTGRSPVPTSGGVSSPVSADGASAPVAMDAESRERDQTQPPDRGGLKALDTVIALPVWPGLEYELALRRQMDSSTDLGVFIASIDPLAEAGDATAAYLIIDAFDGCGPSLGTEDGPDLDAAEQRIMMMVDPREQSLNLQQLERCRQIHQDWEDHRFRAAWHRAEALGHPALRARHAIGGVVSNEVRSVMTALRESIPSFHPDALRHAGMIVAMQDLMLADQPTSTYNPWELLACTIELRTMAEAADPGCAALAQNPAVVAEANRIAQAILAEDWEAIGIADPLDEEDGS